MSTSLDLDTLDLDLDDLDLSLSKAEAERIVKDHGHSTRLDAETGVLMGGILGMLMSTRETFTEWSPVPLDVLALRNWLGY